MENSNFKALVAKMNVLQENELGKLKGGIQVVNSTEVAVEGATNYALCGGNGYCPRK